MELLRHRGFSLAHAVSRLVPPAWERDRDLPPDVRAFYEFQSLVAEPWDGPSALVFADGRYVGAALDRNGFRPARYVATADGLVALASEVGILPASEHEIVDRGRLGPGEMLLVDLDRHRVWGAQDIRRRLAFRRRYRDMVASAARALSPASARLPIADDRPPVAPSSVARAPLAQRQAAFGCTREEIELILKPMLADAHEAVGSMGDDTPPAVLSSRSRLLTDFFRQRFAQVTNPPVDPYRESTVMSLTSLVGAHGSFLDELAARAPRIVLRSPVLSREQLAHLESAEALGPVMLDATCDPSGGADAFDARLDALAAEACDRVRDGAALLILTDRATSAARAPLPAVLAVAAVHQALTVAGLRLRASLVSDTGDARDAHQLAVLCAYGASAVCPSLGFDTIDALASDDGSGCRRPMARYRLALERGLLTIMSKMGVCTFSGYCGAQLFEAIGLDATVIDRFVPGTASPLGGVTLSDIAETAIARHRQAFATDAPRLAYPGLHTYRRDGEYHATNPLVVKTLQRARGDAAIAHRATETAPNAYDTFTSHVYGRPPVAVRDLLEFQPRAPIAINDVEAADDICRRFFASAMSVGALSPEAHRLIAVAMNRINARSNSGEGGEEPDRFARPASGDWSGSRTKQVASARFGVTPAYLRSADELQIKIAQGSKPGEGGQLPGMKVVSHIARLRHAQPGTPLISPPVHHDIYSIEDLAQLVFDLRTFNPAARINVKLVASTGIGVIATGVAKAGADAIQISGHDGGTGASPRASIKHAGMPWEIGLAEAHQALTRAGLRHRVILQTDGGLKTGRDIAIAAALGADEYGFGTAALVAIGCVMARQCHLNTCPVGIATQREDLRIEFAATPEMLIGYLRLVAGEVREILASIGLRSVDALIGRPDLLRQRDVPTALSLGPLLTHAHSPNAPVRRATAGPTTRAAALRLALPIVKSGAIANTDRAFGADVAGAIAATHGDAGLPDGSVQFFMTGSAGQSFGAFALPGMRLTLVGDANDGLGKGMHGGEIVVAPAARERGRAGQVLAGNAALYGATGGRLFVAGHVGERFAVRNSGAVAVIEGAGDHACEYMTGGIVLVLGPVGRNFAAGMTGGVAFVADRERTLAARLATDLVSVAKLTASELRVARDLIETHERLTGSRLARGVLRNDPALSTFVAVRPATCVAAVDDEADGRELPAEARRQPGAGVRQDRDAENRAVNE